MTTATFIDIASWQHPNGAGIDWARVAATGVTGVIIKATQGTSYVNPYYEGDVAGAHAAGLAVGAYHFCDMGEDSPEAEAAFFVANTVADSLELGRWADVEEPFRLFGQDLASWVQTFLNSSTGHAVPCGLYTTRDGLANLIGAPWNARLWLALGGAEPTQNVLIGQTGTGPVDGISSNADLDTCYNARAFNLPGNASGGPPPPPPPTPTPTPTTEVYTMEELRQGATGVQVKVLQWLLNEEGGAALTVDGDFGALTNAAVTVWQTSHGLTVDGVVGPLTWASLLV